MIKGIRIFTWYLVIIFTIGLCLPSHPVEQREKDTTTSLMYIRLDLLMVVMGDLWAPWTIGSGFGVLFPSIYYIYYRWTGQLICRAFPPSLYRRLVRAIHFARFSRVIRTWYLWLFHAERPYIMHVGVCTYVRTGVCILRWRKGGG